MGLFKLLCVGIAYYLVSLGLSSLWNTGPMRVYWLRGSLSLVSFPPAVIAVLHKSQLISFRCPPPPPQQVDLERTFTFRNSKQTYSGIPIIVANMDTVGTFEMAVVMSQVRTQPLLGRIGVSGAWSLSFFAESDCCKEYIFPASVVQRSVLSKPQ